MNNVNKSQNAYDNFTVKVFEKNLNPAWSDFEIESDAAARRFGDSSPADFEKALEVAWAKFEAASAAALEECANFKANKTAGGEA